MRALWLIPAMLAMAAAAAAQDAPSAGASLTAVYTLADHHTTRFTADRDPLVKIEGACRITPAETTYTLSCSGPPAERRLGRRHFYSVVLFQDLNETLYMAACAALSRDNLCEELRAGQTFSAEVEDRAIRIVIHGEQLPLRILEMRPKPVAIDSPTRGTPSDVRPSAGAPSKVPYSNVPPDAGTPSNVPPSQVSVAAGVPSGAPPSEVSTAATSPTGARLYVYCSSGAARIYVDNRLVGRSPANVPLVPGRHTVVVKAEGFADWSQRVEVPAGKIIRITAELER